VHEDAATDYCTQAAIAITGALERESIEDAIRQVINRHEILRTTFHRLPGMDLPLQVVGDEIAFELDRPSPEIEAMDRGETIRYLLKRMAEAGLDLEKDLPLRGLLVEQAADDHLLLLSAPALCIDGPGMKGLIGEIINSYAAIAEGGSFDLEPMQYADLAEWQNELLESEDSKPGREFWSQQKASGLGSLSLIFEEECDNSVAYKPDYVTVHMDSELVDKVETLALRCDAPLSAVLLAGWKTLLYRLTRQSEVGIAVAFDGRNYEELQGAIGLFTRHLPIFTELDERSGFFEVVRKLKATTASAEQWQECFTAGGRILPARRLRVHRRREEGRSLRRQIHTPATQLPARPLQTQAQLPQALLPPQPPARIRPSLPSPPGRQAHDERLRLASPPAPRP
jgi:hypothetical protein